LNIENIKNKKILEEKSESADPTNCLLFASDDVIPGKQTSKQPVEC